MDKKKPSTLHEMLNIPFGDAEFVRFIKENNAYGQLIKGIHNTRKEYHQQTLKSEHFLEYITKERKYLVRLLPWFSNSTVIGWSQLEDKWEKEIEIA